MFIILADGEPIAEHYTRAGALNDVSSLEQQGFDCIIYEDVIDLNGIEFDAPTTLENNSYLWNNIVIEWHRVIRCHLISVLINL